jgi:hypothetical protein
LRFWRKRSREKEARAVNKTPDPPPEPPDEQALAYMSKVGEAVVEQIVAAQVNGGVPFVAAAAKAL